MGLEEVTGNWRMYQEIGRGSKGLEEVSGDWRK
jgi:hypothetical protein